MDLNNNCSPDIQEIDNIINLYKNKKELIIESKLVSGEYNDKILEIALKEPIIILLLFSGKDKKFIVKSDSLGQQTFFSAAAKEFIDKLYKDINLTEHILHEVSKYTIEAEFLEKRSEIILNINSKKYCFNLIRKEIEETYLYHIECFYYANLHSISAYDYLFALIENNKEDYLNALLQHATMPYYSDGEEIITF